LCDQNYPSKTAFKFLYDIQTEFQSQNGSKITTVSRPYHFIEFGGTKTFFCCTQCGQTFADSYIQTARRRYAAGGGGAARYNLSAVNNELQDVQRVMVQNIEDVIHRGEALNSECHFCRSKFDL
jgi:vesicle transport protein SEC22